MKQALVEIKSEIKNKFLAWNNIESKSLKVLLLLIGLGLIGLKVFTTVLTFNWLPSLLG
ncbi:hypothetical protein [Pseudoalteromonas luteoviolacea]|uniref:Preprotein translocase subunit SecE n=1 Tax=Pseudoalteromonas luteoviolacea DSM 6061 TaxID=1365250 RepID=A0A166V7M7_9GAMM|nr:hypothetical protein [Pseudoalteromonas luteoviolacea]KZN31805.1 hypothetical protein N475_22725 [Pseudoalteromonas luteoviolacea DSM 6061]KZN52777.1 hypothetical protein N474_22670 [Pseudoalteromonas luteoviolacea CPMOR-2]MBE0389730.1 hypothetical protein [Pseudoalteromonas luteoviolacea DSM 6061]